MIHFFGRYQQVTGRAPRVPDGVVQERMALGLSSHISVGYASTDEAIYSSLKAMAGSVLAARRAGAQQARAAMTNSSTTMAA
jgi:hypothetical protein